MVQPRPGTGRHFSAGADATHFVNCKGNVTIERCLFENQLDDAANVHGIYAKIEEVVDERHVMVQLGHNQQKDLPFVFKGDKCALVASDTLLPEGHVIVVKTRKLNSDKIMITLDDTGNCRAGMLLENLTWTPEFTLTHCTMKRNRARGILLSTPRKIVVEDNIFSSGGAAVQCGGEGTFWFESGALSDVTIRRNTFSECNRGPWGRAIIDFDSQNTLPGGSQYYNRNILIIDNVFETFHPALIYARSVKDLIITHNRAEYHEGIEPLRGYDVLIELVQCHGAVIIENTVDPAFAQAPLEFRAMDQHDVETDMDAPVRFGTV
jgi:hypothetical protein